MDEIRDVIGYFVEIVWAVGQSVRLVIVVGDQIVRTHGIRSIGSAGEKGHGGSILGEMDSEV